MPRFHFHVEDGRSYSDDEGAELADAAAARAYALRYFGHMLESSQVSVWNGNDLRMEVADESGLVLFSLYLVGIDSPAATGGLDPAMISAEPMNPEG
ncbi:MAG TPA: hypothetical protein VF605_14445 [Allosphingosinicella sp.]|jgi:hypothetical protein